MTDLRSEAQRTLRECVAQATLAPSLHNSQPWIFEIADDSVQVYADPTRQLGVLDPYGRELLISVGAALFTLRLALRAAGHRPVTQLLLQDAEPDLVARVKLGAPFPPTPAVQALSAAIAHRHTNRWPFAPTVVPADVVEHLSDAARCEGADFSIVSAVSRNAILGLSQAAERRLRGRDGYRAELARWTRPAPHRHDGVPPTVIGPWDALEQVPIRDFGLLPTTTRRPQEKFEPYPTIAVLATDGDSAAQWVAAGQALQRVLLTATGLGLATTPISQPVELPAVRELLTDTSQNHWAQLVLRLGYGQPAAATPRRPIEDVLR